MRKRITITALLLLLATSFCHAQALTLAEADTIIVVLLGEKSVLLVIFKSLISLCFITCLIRISLNLKNDQKNRPHDPMRSNNMTNIHYKSGQPY